MHDGGTPLLSVIDRTLTAMGARLLKRWLVFPLKDKKPIEDRLNIVEYYFREPEFREIVEEQLQMIGDLERIIAKVAAGRVSPRELVQLKLALQAVEPIKNACENSSNAVLKQLGAQLDCCADIRDRIAREINPEPPLLLNKGGVVAEGVDARLDELREIAYNGKTVDIIHISTVDYQLTRLAEGTLLIVDLDGLQAYIDNDEAYFVWRMPHKSLDEVFKPRVNMENVIARFIDLITTPVVSEKYGYSIRINEARLLPEQIVRSGAFHRQKLKKAVITISVSEDDDINDEGCYRIRHLEEELYCGYVPEKYKTEDVISYQWHQNRESNLQGQFNFYYNITKNSISGVSMTIYMILLMLLAVMGEILGDFAKTLLGLQ
jgi:hypothetical protein